MRLSLLRPLLLAASLAVPLVSASSASAHGIWGHIHVTGWAIENLPPGELRDFFAEPEVLNAALFGAAFTDSGYWPQGGELQPLQRAYGEHTHWEPFIEDAIQWIQANDPPPWDDIESRKRIAFVMGCAAHGLQDEIFDTLFLYFTDAEDGAGQDQVDPASDGFLALDGYLRMFPEEYVPFDMLLELYADVDERITEDVIQRAVDTMTLIYVNERRGPAVARASGEQNADRLPWTRAYQLDPSIPGSLRAEILPTGRYLQAIWDRLHGTFGPDDVVTWTFPAPGRYLVGPRADHPESWTTFVFGVGVRGADVQSVLVDALEAPVPVTSRGTRWGGFGGWGRLAVLRPGADLVPGGTYTASIESGLSFINGLEPTFPLTHTFVVTCDETTDDCPDVGTPDETCVLPTEPGCEWLAPPIDEPGEDTGVEPGDDTGVEPADDVGVDPPDAGDPADSTAPEPDAGADTPPDAPAPADEDTTSAADTSAPEADDGEPATSSGTAGGGGCATAPAPTSHAGWALLLGVVGVGLRRRRRAAPIPPRLR